MTLRGMFQLKRRANAEQMTKNHNQVKKRNFSDVFNQVFLLLEDLILPIIDSGNIGQDGDE